MYAFWFGLYSFVPLGDLRHVIMDIQEHVGGGYMFHPQVEHVSSATRRDLFLLFCKCFSSSSRSK
jgi:hypothetical protein